MKPEVNIRWVNGSPDALELTLAVEVAAVREPDPLVPLGVLLGGTLMRPGTEWDLKGKR